MGTASGAHPPRNARTAGEQSQPTLARSRRPAAPCAWGTAISLDPRPFAIRCTPPRTSTQRRRPLDIPGVSGTRPRRRTLLPAAWDHAQLGGSSPALRPRSRPLVAPRQQAFTIRAGRRSDPPGRAEDEVPATVKVCPDLREELEMRMHPQVSAQAEGPRPLRTLVGLEAELSKRRVRNLRLHGGGRVPEGHAQPGVERHARDRPDIAGAAEAIEPRSFSEKPKSELNRFTSTTRKNGGSPPARVVPTPPTDPSSVVATSRLRTAGGSGPSSSRRMSRTSASVRVAH